MEKVITVGRDNSNEIVIMSDFVSLKHAELIININGNIDEITINDLNSKNGTYKNGMRIQTTTINSGDRIRFADQEVEYQWLLNEVRLFKDIGEVSKQRYSDNFLKIKKTYEEFVEDINKLKEADNKRRILIQFTLSMIVALIGLILWIQFNVGMIVMLLSPMVGLLMGIVIKPNPKIQQDIKDRTKIFLENYKCQKCGRKFGTTSIQLLEAQGKCPACGEIWVNENI